jgi:uncharacterized membrane protein YciS (DUF1049 family)
MAVGILFVIAITIISVTAIVSENRKAIAVARMKMQGQDDPHLQATITALREEVRALRDTSMQYDLSFDTALQKIDQRVGSLERRVNDSTEVHELRLGQ